LLARARAFSRLWRPLRGARAGLPLWGRGQRLATAGMVLACAGFVGFICSMIIFKGDLSWGPRYLTPVFAVLWVFVPAAASVCSRPFTGFLLGLGALVQVLGLSVDYHRLYAELSFPSGF